MSDSADIRGDYSKAFVFVGIVVFILFLGSLALTAGSGFEDSAFTSRFIIYSLFAVFGLGAIFFVVNFNKARGRKVFLVPLHEPEDSLTGSVKVFRRPLLFFLLCLIVFTPIFFVSARFANTFFSGIPFQSPQQVSIFSNIFGDSVFPALAENLLMFIPIVLLLSGNWFLFRRVKPIFWFVNIVFIPLIMAFVWLSFHNLVYGSNQFAGLFTWIFGFLGVLLTLVTMSFIPWAVIHFVSNFMLSAKAHGLLVSDIFLFEVFGVWILCIVTFFGLLYFGRGRG